MSLLPPTGHRNRRVYIVMREETQWSLWEWCMSVCIFMCVDTQHKPQTEQGCDVHLSHRQVAGIENVKECVCVSVPNKDMQVLVGNNLPRDRRRREDGEGER